MKTTKSIFTLILCLLAFGVDAQIFTPDPHIPATNLPGPTPVTNVTNTGNASTDFFGDLITASVCDGNIPRINVIQDAGVVNVTEPLGVGSGINDPDVVTFPPVPGDNVVVFYVVYEQFGEIKAQDWTYDPSGGTLTAGIIEVISTGGSSHPNIDGVGQCGIGIVYERGGEIFGRFGSLGPLCPTASFPSNLNAEVSFSACTPSGNSQPDISLFHDGSNTMANIVYIQNTGATESLIIQRHSINDFINANPVVCSENETLLTVSTADESLHLPRIASVNGTIPGDDRRDCQIVVEHRFGSSSGHEILGFNRNENAAPGLYTPTNFNLMPMNTQQCENQRPVVAYTPCDRFIVQWEYQGPCLSGLPAGNGHIIGKKMDDAGNIISTDYEVSNIDLSTHAEIPSVCGRFVTSSPPFSSTHVNHDYQRLMVKGTGTSCMDATMSPVLETAHANPDAKSDISIYPNPAEGLVTLKASSSYYTYEITDLSGKVMSLGTLNQGENTIEVNFLSAGTYIVRFHAESRIDHRKLIIR